ncbi:MAG TPA: NAD(P)-dependent alcohol dehydrogenase [Thermodesulfobacteriota bacterium]|nr:NAD(P)-dependent alcohol dehydrogenase [Thermodesulfobacteriota bacterium]
MKVFEIKQAAGIDSLDLVERPNPKPGYGQVLVRIKAVSLNYRDLLVVKGAYSRNLPSGLIPCSDGAGEVVEVGDGVSRVKPGDRVAGTFFQTWISGGLDESKAKSALGGAIDGVLAEYVLFNQDGLVHIPEHLSYEEGATLPCAAVTAWNGLVTSGGMKPGDTVLVMGTGGVSIFALQFAKISGARVIATSSSDEKLERVKQMGASDGINYKSVPDWEKRVWELTSKVGVDHVVEVGGAGTLAKSLRAVRIGGHISLIGVLSGAGEANPLPAVMKNVRIQGIYVGSRDMFEAMNSAISLHQLHPVIDRVFPFEGAKEAFSYMESGAHFGKVVIRL